MEDISIFSRMHKLSNSGAIYSSGFVMLSVVLDMPSCQLTYNYVGNPQCIDHYPRKTMAFPHLCCQETNNFIVLLFGDVFHQCPVPCSRFLPPQSGGVAFKSFNPHI